jgi:DNA-binding response OmpR family regulator
MRILLVEDDVNLSNDLKHQLLMEHFEIETAYDGTIAERMARRHQYDCMLIDVNIPGINGYELVRRIREINITTPVIMITAFGEIDDRLTGFENGADDYITKPFFFKELLARIRVFIKRSGHYAKEQDVLQIEDLQINLARREVSRGGNIIRLTAREFQLLVMLAEADGNPVSKKEILGRVWGTSFDAQSNTIEVFINFLRNKIDKPFEPKLIKTRIGFGYYLSKD